jgi:hypothetical protein
MIAGLQSHLEAQRIPWQRQGSGSICAITLSPIAFAAEIRIGERTLRRFIQDGKASKRIQKALAKGIGSTVKDLFGMGQ